MPGAPPVQPQLPPTHPPGSAKCPFCILRTAPSYPLPGGLSASRHITPSECKGLSLIRPRCASLHTPHSYQAAASSVSSTTQLEAVSDTIVGCADPAAPTTLQERQHLYKHQPRCFPVPPPPVNCTHTLGTPFTPLLATHNRHRSETRPSSGRQHPRVHCQKTQPRCRLLLLPLYKVLAPTSKPHTHAPTLNKPNFTGSTIYGPSLGSEPDA